MGPRLTGRGSSYDRTGLINLVFLVGGWHFRPPIPSLPPAIAILASDEAAHYIYGDPDPHRA